MSSGWVLRSRRVATPEGLRPAALLIREGLIHGLHPYDQPPAAESLLDAGDLAVLPGLVDTHVHVNEPGRAEWEGFETATQAAAAGGITAIVDMPLNSDPVTTRRAALEAKLRSAAGRSWVDAAFWGGVVPGNLSELLPMIEAGVAGFKAFLIHSGIEDFPSVGEAELRAAMPLLARRGRPLLVHAELCSAPAPAAGDPRSYASYLASRPKSWENEAIRLVLALSRETGCRVHIVHLSSAEALPLLAEAKAAGAPVTAETCPHYLRFAAEQIPDGATQFKCSPPIREAANRERLWEGLRRGTIDMVVSDHSPCTPELKGEDGDFHKAWGGISSLQFSLPAVWTGARERGFTLGEVVSWMSAGPARLAGLVRKGRLAPSADADMVVFDPEAEFAVEPGIIRHRHKLTPFAGLRLRGAVKRTFVRGREVFRDGAFPEGPRGELLFAGSGGL